MQTILVLHTSEAVGSSILLWCASQNVLTSSRRFLFCRLSSGGEIPVWIPDYPFVIMMNWLLLNIDYVPDPFFPLVNIPLMYNKDFCVDVSYRTGNWSLFFQLYSHWYWICWLLTRIYIHSFYAQRLFLLVFYNVPLMRSFFIFLVGLSVSFRCLVCQVSLHEWV